MNYSSLLTDQSLAWVLDTSVAINLCASTFGLQILSAFANPVVMARIAAEELKQGTTGRTFLEQLLEAELITISELTDAEYDVFGELSLTVDDGEAATIAIAKCRSFFPFIDDQKGRSKTSSAIAGLEPGWSLDLFRHPAVISTLGKPAEEDAVFLALKEGRMRIPSSRVDEVIDIIGRDRAALCISIPNYKARFMNNDYAGE